MNLICQETSKSDFTGQKVVVLDEVNPTNKIIFAKQVRREKLRAPEQKGVSLVPNKCEKLPMTCCAC